MSFKDEEVLEAAQHEFAFHLDCGKEGQINGLPSREIKVPDVLWHKKDLIFRTLGRITLAAIYGCMDFAKVI